MESEFIPHSHVPYGEDGSGYYSDHVQGCYDVMKEAEPYVMSAIDSVEFDASMLKAFCIADYGTADGGTSMPLISTIIGKIKEKYGTEQEVQVNYEDQPMNDFKSLFLRTQGINSDEPSYLKKYKGVFVNACGTGFYSQCFPTTSVNLGFCATAMHWLYERPCQLKTALHHTGTGDESEKRQFFEAAEKCWNLILVNRAKELAPGGHMIISNLGMDGKGQYLGHSERVKESMFANMTKHWRDMVSDGLITENEFLSTTFNNYYRSEDEVTAPFKKESSSVYKAGLRLVAVKTHLIPCPYNTAWLKSGKGKDDRDACRMYAKDFIPTTRVWSNSTFISGLDDSRTEEEKCKIVDEFYKRYEAQVAQNPADHAMDYVHVYLHFKKVQ